LWASMLIFQGVCNRMGMPDDDFYEASLRFWQQTIQDLESLWLARIQCWGAPAHHSQTDAYGKETFWSDH